MKKITYFTCLFICFISLNLSGQISNFRNITTNNGLASNETYYTLQASDGYLYISTDRGLQRYDGRQYLTLPFQDSSLNGSTVFSIYEDVHKTIWVCTYRKGLYYLDGDSLKPYTHNEVLLELLKDSFIERFFFDETGDLNFSIMKSRDVIYRINQQATIDQIGFKKSFNDYCEDIKTVFIKGDAVLSETLSADTSYNLLNDSTQNFTVTAKGQVTDSPYYPRGSPSLLHGDSVLVGISNILVIYTKGGTYIDEYAFEKQILWIYVDSFNQLLLGTESGLYRITPTGEVEHYLKNFVINCIVQDKDDGYWINTISNGLFYRPSFDIKVLPSTNKVARLASYKNHLMISDFAPSLSSYYIENSSPELDTVIKVGYPLLGMYLDSSLLGLKKVSFKIQDSIFNPTALPFVPSKTYVKLDDFTFLASKKQGIYSFEPGHIKGQTRIIDSAFFCHTLHAHDSTIYAGTDHGVIKYHLESETYEYLLPQVLQQVVTSIETLNDSVLIVGSKTNGVFMIQGARYVHLTTNNSCLLSSSCSSLAIENDSTFWIGTDIGVSRIQLQKSGHACTTLSKDDGLISRKVNDLEIVEDLLFIGTDLGCCYLNTQMHHHNSKPVLIKPEIPVTDYDRFENDTLWLKPGVRNLLMNFNTITFKNTEHLTFSYLVAGEQHIETPSNIFYIDKLEPGVTSLNVNVANVNHNWNPHSLDLTIIAPPYFYEELWFKVIGSLFLLLLLAGVIYGYLTFHYHRKLQKWKFSTMQLRELNLQLNPHFIFNAISNIRNLASDGNTEDMNTFIANFSSLTRKVLDNSKFKVIPLTEEIENIKKYIELEQLRFKDKPFQFKLDISSEIDLQQALVPPMILQPCVENAIWHGLLPKKENRFLLIKFAPVDQGFHVIIQDNGIGLKHSEKNNRHTKHKTSVGILNTKMRLALYEEMNLGKASFTLSEETLHKQGSSGVIALFQFYPNPANLHMI